MSCLEPMGCYCLLKTGFRTLRERAGSALSPAVKTGERPCDYSRASAADNCLL